MKRLLILFLLPVLLSACAAKPAVASLSPTPSPRPSLAPSPKPTPEATDLDQNDEADFYFDFGQDDRIELNYEVGYPASEMEGWTVAPNTRVSALLTLHKGESILTVLVEDAPEYASLEEYMEYASLLMSYNYEGARFEEPQRAGANYRVRGELQDGRLFLCEYGTVNGLYTIAELIAAGEGASGEVTQFEEIFLPQLTFTYTEIDPVGGCHEEE